MNASITAWLRSMVLLVRLVVWVLIAVSTGVLLFLTFYYSLKVRTRR